MNFTHDIAARLVDRWNERIPEPFKADQFPSYIHGVMVANGEYRVFRPLEIVVPIDSDALKSTGVELGSEGFMEAYVDGPAGVFSMQIGEAVQTAFGARTVLARKLQPPRQSTAPYHWYYPFEWRGIPVEVEASVVDSILTLRYRMFVGLAEGV